jgi:GNAT superfamily N-acetyltransferase
LPALQVRSNLLANRRVAGEQPGRRRDAWPDHGVRTYGSEARMKFSLVQCDDTGIPVDHIPDLPQELAANCAATADLYRRVGYQPPWVGYVAVVDGRGVGGGAFVGPPRDGRVEIAYYTLKDHEGRGYASMTAASLVDIARRHDPQVTLLAFTLIEQNASTRILGKLGFRVYGTAQDADAGEVLEWRT